VTSRRPRPPPGVRPAAIKLPTTKRGFVLQLRRWVVERLCVGHERPQAALEGLH
jgi:hypothetical protein